MRSSRFWWQALVLALVASGGLFGCRGKDATEKIIPASKAGMPTSDQNPPWSSFPVTDPVPPETLIHNAPVQTYEVMGRTRDELSANVDLEGTQRRGAPAKTTYHLLWHPGNSLDGNCGLRNGTVTADIIVTLPMWVNMPTNTDEARQWWSYSIKQMTDQQQAHIDEAIKNAVEATQDMQQTRCDTANSEWAVINDRLALAQSAYDNAHGNVETDLKFEPSTDIPVKPAAEATSTSGTAAPKPLARPAASAGAGFPTPLARGTVPGDYSLPLTTLDGNRVSLESMRGQVVVLNFWATWCGFCKVEEPSFETLVQQLTGKNIAFAFITTEPAAKVKAFIDQSHWTVPIYLTTPEAASPYESSGIPETIIMAKNGDRVMKVPGSRDWSAPGIVGYLNALIDE